MYPNRFVYRFMNSFISRLLFSCHGFLFLKNNLRIFTTNLRIFTAKWFKTVTVAESQKYSEISVSDCVNSDSAVSAAGDTAVPANVSTVTVSP